MPEVRMGLAALDVAKGQVTNPTPIPPAGPEDWFRDCLVFVRFCFNVGPRDGSAEIGFNQTEFRHGTDGTPPLGVPVWWTNGGSGHVALSTGDGSCYSTDILRHGKVDKVAISFITRQWGANYRGWTEDVNGVRVYRPDAPSLPAVSLASVREAARKDQFLPPGQGLHKTDVIRVERALRKKDLKAAADVDGFAGTDFRRAYGKWQKKCDVPRPFDGIPGIESLTRLGNEHGFRVVS